MSGVECPIESLRSCLAFSSRDWSNNHRDAWLYGVVFGWDENSIAELKAKHKWSSSEVERLNRLRKKFNELERIK
jgi:hypothetical protein